MAINWKDSSPAAPTNGASTPWFAISIGLIGLIVGYMLPSFLSSL